MLIEQIIEFELRGPGPPGRTCTFTAGYFHSKPKISKKNLLRQVLFTSKIFQEAMYVTSPYVDQITLKI